MRSQDTGEWPSGLLSAFVSLLAKVPRPTSAKDGRPITILPTLYRIWGKIVSRKIFAAIVDHLPPDSVWIGAWAFCLGCSVGAPVSN